MYPSDLTQEQWHLLSPYLVKPLSEKQGRGRPPKQDFYAEVNAILYVVKTGCQWRQLPLDFPPWQTVYGLFRRWQISGAWDKAMHELREKARVKAGRNAEPTVAIIDSRSVKTASKGGSAVSMVVKR